MRRPLRRARRWLAAPLALLAAASACTAPAPDLQSDGVYTLKIADSYPKGHPFSEAGAQVFMDRARKLSGGRIRFEYFPAEQMGKAADLPTLIRTGVVDMGAVAPAYVPAELPLSGVADLPGLVDNSCTGSIAVSHLMAEGGILWREDFEPKGLRPLVVGMIPGYEVMTRSKPVQTPADLRGLQLRSSGGTIDRTVEGLGAEPVGMPATEMYQAIARGTVDGTVLGPVSAAPYHLEEVLNYATVGARLGSFTMTYSINEASWDALPKELQDALRQAGKAATRSLCAALQAGNVKGRQKLADAGVRLYHITGEQRVAWAKATEPVRQQWIADMAAIGRPGAAALKAMKQELRQVRRAQNDDS